MTYHYSKFIGLMSNYNIVTEANEKALSSQGSAMKENEKYVDSLTGRWNIFKTTMQGLYQQLISSDFLKNFVSGLTQTVTVIGRVVDALGGLNTAILLIGSSLAIFKMGAIIQGLSSLTFTISGITGALTSLGIALKGLFLNPVGLGIIAVTAITAGIVAYANKQQKLKEQTEAVTKAQNNFNKALDDFGKSSNGNDANSAITSMQKSLDDMMKNYPQYEATLEKEKKLKQEIYNTEQIYNQKKASGKLNSYDENWYIQVLQRLSKEYDTLLTKTNPITKATKELADAKKLNTLNTYLESESSKKLENDIKNLNLITDNASKGEKLTAEQKSELIKLHPELSASIEKVGDSYVIEQGAVENLRQSLIAKQETVINAQIAESKSTFDGLEERLKSYGIEIDAINTLADAQKAAANLTTGTSDTSKNSGYATFFAEYLKSDDADKISDKLITYGKILDVAKAEKEKIKSTTFGLNSKFSPPGKKDLGGSSDISPEKYTADEKNKILVYEQNLSKATYDLELKRAELEKTSNQSLNKRIQGLKEEKQLMIEQNEKLGQKTWAEGQLANDKRWQLNNDYGLQFDSAGNINVDNEYDIIKTRTDELNILNDRISKMDSGAAKDNAIQSRDAKKMQLDNFKKWVEEYKKYLTDHNNDMVAFVKAQGEINKKEAEIDKNITDEIFKNQELAIEPLTNELDKLKSSFDLLEDVQFDEKLANITNQIETQKKLIAEYDTQIEELGKAWWNATTQEEKDRIHEKADSFRKEKTSLTKSIKDDESTKVDIKIEQLFKPAEDLKKEFESKKKQLEHQMNMLSDDDLVGKETIRQKIISETIKYQSNLNKELNKVKATTDSTIVSTDKYKNSLNELIDVSNSTDEALKDLNKTSAQEKLNAIEAVEQKIQDILKKGLDKEKQNLDDKLKAYNEYVDGKIEALDRENNAKDYDDEMKEKIADRQEIQDKINVLSLANDFESYQKRKELEEQLAEANKDIKTAETKRSRDLQKQNLQDQKTSYQKYVDDKKTSLDKEFSDEEIKIKAHTILMEQSFDSVKDKLPSLFTEISNNTNGLVTFQNTFTTFETLFGNGVASLGDKVNKEFTSKVDLAIQSATKLKEIMQELDGNSTSVSKTNTGSQIINDKKKIGALQREWNQLNNAKQNNLPYDSKRMQDVENKSQEIRNRNNWEFEDLRTYGNLDSSKYPVLDSFDKGISDGAVKETGNYLLHQGEIVLNPSQMVTFFKNMSTRLLPNLNLSVPNFSNVGTTNNSTFGDVNLYLNVSGISDDSIINQIKGASTVFAQDFKKQINKFGQFKLS